ncbi:hypothetical protein [Tenacibaculum sp. 1_MG-2023]|uniref:hypothetical protein n=1 Tax=Tenacibaculum sp. 1_MG-2023 TaxID=3062653 RepID=UPI0026E4634A|nr:hypothetical protein [Tenacibaculum sp. 1_MG-2023]MDO6598728.1 hypothetical protein [Tenacibaculum sp. 1_MG-2023]
MKENKYIKSLKLGFERESGISFNDLVKELSVNFDNDDQKSNFIIWFYSNFYNEKSERLITAHFVATSSAYKIQDRLESFNTINEKKSYIKGDALNKYIDYLELERTRKSSRNASRFSLIAIVIAAIGIIAPQLNNKNEPEKSELKVETIKQNFNLIGIYEYKTREQSENHFIVIDSLNGKYNGIYFGTEDNGGHGVFFYGNGMENLNIENDKVSFEIGHRNLYESTRFRIIKNKRDFEKDSSNGISKSRLKFSGEISPNGFNLNCESEFGDCWSSKMDFKNTNL